MRINELLNEVSSSGSTSSGNIAALPGVLSFGFTDDDSASIYPSNKKKNSGVATGEIIRRPRN